jgi:hypothetical protein
MQMRLSRRPFIDAGGDDEAEHLELRPRDAFIHPCGDALMVLTPGSLGMSSVPASRWGGPVQRGKQAVTLGAKHYNSCSPAQRGFP